MTRTDLLPLAEEERTELLALLQSLSPTQWDAPSLCRSWNVRDVAAHVVSYDELSTAGTVATFVRGGLRTARINEVALRRYADLGPDQVIELVARCRRPRGLPSLLGGGIALTDGTIHHQDIRRALGLPRVVPEHRLVPVLDFVAHGADPAVQGQPARTPARRHRRRLVVGLGARGHRPRRGAADGRRRPAAGPRRARW